MSPLVAIGLAVGWLAGPRVASALRHVSRPRAWTYSTRYNEVRELGAAVSWQSRTVGGYVVGRPH